MNSGFLSKWSSKPANHKANRVRNNQRRHREKVKHHIAQLESSLSKTQLQLNNALQTIETLRGELEKAYTLASAHGSNSSQCRDNVLKSANPSKEQSLPSPTGEETGFIRSPIAVSCENSRQQTLNGLDVECFEVEKVALGMDSEGRPSASRQKEPEEPGLSFNMSAPCTTNPSVVEEFTDHEKLFLLKPPAPLESTTRCRDAFKIIQEHNFLEVEPSAIWIWLESGFRKAVVEGDGCRVENKLLFALLDHINPS